METKSNNQSSTGKLLKAADLAERLQISRSFAYLLMKRGVIPTVRINRAVRVRQSDLEQYIENNLSKSLIDKTNTISQIAKKEV